MSKVVLDVGNCGPDHNSICNLVTGRFKAQVIQAHGAEDAIQILATRQIDLVLINRKLDQDYSDGVEVLKAIKADERFRSVPVMLITNYEEHQQQAVSLGALPGFGKLALSSPQTIRRLAAILSERDETPA
ncbi:MAG: response regulator [Pirellulaceae bacterium]|nr:response regulator [Pirellulaceae bacterium]